MRSVSKTKWGPKRYSNIVAHLTEDPPEHFHEVAVSRDACGNYYCSFVYDDATQENRDDEHKPGRRRKKRIGDHALRQMVIKKKEHGTRQERNKRRIRNRLVYNDWGLSGFVQMLEYKCLRFGKELYRISERDTTKMCHKCKHKQDMPLWKRTYRCEHENCGLVMDRDENSAVNLYQRFVARLPPHR